MEQQRSEKESAIMALDYFDFFTKNQITSACKLCVIRQFKPLETIYCDDEGHLSYVHFVLSGECMILQCLEVMAHHKGGVRKFELIDMVRKDPNSLRKGDSSKDLSKIMRNVSNARKNYDYNIDDNIATDYEDYLEHPTKPHGRIRILSFINSRHPVEKCATPSHHPIPTNFCISYFTLNHTFLGGLPSTTSKKCSSIHPKAKLIPVHTHWFNNVNRF